MKIKAVRMREVGLFRDAVALEGFSGGLDVLAGDNEFGKSTIFRALSAVLLTKHTAIGKAIDALKPRGGGAPLIEADFEIGGETWRISKQFGRAKNAELRALSGGGEIVRGPDAEDRLNQLIGVDENGLAGRMTLLWVAQKHGLGRPDLDVDPITGKASKRGECSAILRAIESEVAVIAGGPLARGVRRRVEAMLEPLLTATQKPKKNGPLDVALRDREKLSAQLQEAQELANRTAACMDELSSVREREQVLRAPGRRETLQARASSLRAQLADLERQHQQIKTAVAEREAARQKLVSARSVLAAFDKELDELSGLSKSIREDADQLKKLETDFKTAHEAFATADKDVSRLRTRDKQLADLSIVRAQLDSREQARETLSERSRALKTARGLMGSIKDAQGELRREPLEPALMEELSALEREVKIGEGQLAAVSPEVNITLEHSGFDRVRVDGKRVEREGRYVVVEPLVIDIDGVGSIRVAPGQSLGRGEQEQRLSGDRSALVRCLEKAGAVDIAAARERFKDLEKGRLELAGFEAKFAGLAPQGLAVLENEVSRLEASVASAVTSDVPPSADELFDQISDNRAQFENAMTGVENRRANREALLSKVEVGKAQVVARQRRLSELTEKLGGADVRAMKREEFAKSFVTAEEATLAAERACEAFSKIPDADQIEKLKTESADADAAVSFNDRELEDIRVLVARLEERIESADEAGTGVRVAHVEGELERASREVARIEQDVEALKLLRDVLTGASEAAKAQIGAPVLERLIPYLSLLFPEANISFGDNLRIEGLERGDVVENFGSLSDGTAEQLSVVVRLAYARLLAETGTEMPLFLDDPLAYCDDARLGRIFKALHEGARAHQVIVFTCHERAFQPLGGNRVELVPWAVAQ